MSAARLSKIYLIGILFRGHLVLSPFLLLAGLSIEKILETATQLVF